MKFHRSRLELLHFLRLLDERSHDKDFLSLLDLLENPRLESDIFLSGNHLGRDRFPADRQFIDDADVKFPEKGQGHRPWYRRSRHLQDMRTGEFFEKCSLPDAEFMLFVYHYKFEILEIYVLLQNRVRTYQYVDFPLFEVRLYLIFFPFGKRSSKEFYTQTKRQK